MKKWKIIGIIVISILTLIIILQNTASVETKLLLVTVTMSRALLLIMTFIMGFVTGLIASYAVKKSNVAKPAK
jgi:uncharacterized integral membrane protein